MHVYTFWWMSLERPKCGQSQLEASTPRQCAVFRPSVLKITSPSSFCFCASSFCSVSTRTALRKERGSAGQHVWACARYWSEFFGHAQHLEPTWIYTLFHTQSFHTPSLQRPHDWKTTWCPWPARQQPLKVFEGWEADCVKPEAVALPNVFYPGLQADFCNAPSWIVCLFIEITLCDALLNYGTMFCFGLYCHDSLELQVMNGARLHLAWGLHISIKL